MSRKFYGIILFLFITLVLFGCSLEKKPKLEITNAKIAAGIDEKLMPVKITDIFPQGTEKVYCWFEWKNAKINTPIAAKWYYVTDNIHILDYTFTIPRKKGTGSVSLSMPEGKTLPAGEYKLDLNKDKFTLKTLTFTIQ
ncbi:MAG: hypothetical protein ABIH18_06625 [Candidatus Omnitrophota bacterium]